VYLIRDDNGWHVKARRGGWDGVEVVHHFTSEASAKPVQLPRPGDGSRPTTAVTDSRTTPQITPHGTDPADATWLMRSPSNNPNITLIRQTALSNRLTCCLSAPHGLAASGLESRWEYG
jgi:hypothetical protein